MCPFPLHMCTQEIQGIYVLPCSWAKVMTMTIMLLECQIFVFLKCFQCAADQFMNVIRWTLENIKGQLIKCLNLMQRQINNSFIH